MRTTETQSKPAPPKPGEFQPAGDVMSRILAEARRKMEQGQ